QESVDIIARLLESPEPITYEGKYWTLREMRLQLRSYQQPRLPLASVTSGSPASLAMGGQYGMKVFSPIVPPGLPLKEQFPHIEEAAEKHGQKISREDWRAATYVYLADTREQAWADVRTGIERDVHDYFYTINGERAWADYPGQPKSELTAERIAEKRGWIIGTPDDAIERLEQLNEETGGIGGILITTHEWVPHWKSRYSMELFARYVMPHFRGHTADLRDEWERTKRDRADGAIPEILGRDLSSEFPKGGDSTNLRVGI
ncbi:MAG: LLM class flavin-dependent oxidoreductase, partial [Chloroflexota bacterium]